MNPFIQKSILILCLPVLMSAALPAAAQLPAFKSRNTDMCLGQHHFTEQDLLWLSSQAYPDVKGSLNPDGEGFGYLAWKMINHPNVGQGANLGFSLPAELGMSFQPKKMFGFTFPGSDQIGNALNGFGLVIIAGQLVEDIATDNPQLQINLAKNSANWTIGFSKMFSQTMKISSIAVQLFDYTLNELGNAALKGQKQLWYNAYANYFDTEYGHHAADMPKWDLLIERNGGNMKQALDNMHKEFWGDPFRDSFKKQKYIWGNAEPSDAVKIEVRDTYLQGMLPTLVNYYRGQQNKARAAAVLKANSTYNEMVEFMDRKIVFSGKVTSASGRPLAGVSVSLYGTPPVLSNAKGEFRDVFRMCELIPELKLSNNKILASAYYAPDPSQPPRVKTLSRGLTVGFMAGSDTIDSVQDRLDFVFTTDDWIELTLRPQNVELEGGGVTNLTAVCLREDGQSVDVTAEVEWRSDKDAVARVENGRLTAGQGKGTATILATRTKDGVTLTSNPCQVFVKIRREVDRLTIQPATVEIQSNGQAPIQAAALFNDGTINHVTIDPECTWSSHPPTLQVTPQGRLQAGAAVWGAPDHTLTATYTFRGKTVSASIPVRLLSTEKAVELKLNKTEVVMGTNENVGLKATALIGKGTATYPADVTTQVVWTVSDNAIITQTAGGVIVSGGQEGYCGVKAEFRPPNSPALQALCKVTVVDKNRPLPPPDFSIDPKDDPHPAGEKITFRSQLPATSTPLDLIWYLDGMEIPDQSEVTHLFQSPGAYSIRFFVRDPITGKSDAVVKTIHVETPPEEAVSIEFSPETNVYPIGSTVGLVAKAKKLNPQTEYRWVVAGEFIGEGARGVKHTFTEGGEYEIKLGLRRGSNFDEETIARTLVVGEAAIDTLGRLRNRFEARGAPVNLEILSSYWVGGKGEWSTPTPFNGGAIGPVDHYVLHVGDQADGYNSGFLVWAPKGRNELLYRVFHFRWPDRLTHDRRDPHGFIHQDGRLDLHNKTLVPNSVDFTRKASRLCEVEWRTSDESVCRARIGKFRKTDQDAFSGLTDLGCEYDQTGWKSSPSGPHGSISPAADEWAAAGAFVVLSGSHKFDKRWFRPHGNEPDDPFYLNDENITQPARHSREEVMRQASIKQGTFKVRGDGCLVTYSRVKAGNGPKVKLVDTQSGQVFYPHWNDQTSQVMYQTRNWIYKDGQWDGAWTGNWVGMRSKLDPNRLNGRIFSGQIREFDVLIEQTWYSREFAAPSEIEYELWFFPREGGGVKIDRQLP